MYCIKCGREIDDDAIFCPYCGTQVKQANPQYSYYSKPVNVKSNGYAVAGFVLSFFSPLLGWIFSGIGLKKVSETGKGKWLSILGIFISVLNFALNIYLIATGKIDILF